MAKNFPAKWEILEYIQKNVLFIYQWQIKENDMEQSMDRKVKVSRDTNDGKRLKYKITKPSNSRHNGKAHTTDLSSKIDSAIDYAIKHPIKLAIFGIAGFYLVRKYGVKEIVKFGLTAAATSIVAKTTEAMDFNT